MGYDYRRMTQEERVAVVDERRARGYPLHAPPHPYRGPGWYCIHAANFEHANVMSSPERLTGFEDRLLEGLRDAGAEVGAWVVLTNHYHVLVSVASLDQVSGALRWLHGRTSRAWNLEDELTGRRKVWYSFRDRAIRDERHTYHALNYLHFNAVKHGYVDSVYDWPWSSVHLYYDTYGREWLREHWVRYPIGTGWHYGDHG
ncbi:MAG: transposase [Anaerolineae bacterium]|jgi:putative transposase